MCKIYSILALFYVLIFIAFSVTAGAEWEISTVDTNSYAGQDCSLAVIDGQPAIAYRYEPEDSYLMYARFSGSEWETTNVDESNVGDPEYISLAKMPDGNPAIAFCDASGGDLRFTRYDGSAWNTTTIDSTGTTGRFASLCVINGQPAISYLDSSSDLKYARYDGTTWQLTVIDTDARYTTDGRTSLKAQSNGYPAIAYYANKLKYAAFDGTAWTLSTVDSTSGTGRSASLAFGPDGKPAITYYYAAGYTLMFASFDGTTWNIQTAFSGNSYQTGPYNSLAFLPSGVPILSWYQKYSNNYARLNFSWLDNERWNHVQVEGNSYLDNKGRYSSLAILDDSFLGIAYYDAKNYQLDFAKTAYPISATDPDIHYTATAWSAREEEPVVGIDESATLGSWFCAESGYAKSYVEVGSTLPGSISGTITLSGRSCYEGQCIEYDDETGDCLRWGQCLLWNEGGTECLDWQEGRVFQDPNDTSGRLQTQLKIEPTAVMPLGTQAYLHIRLDTTVEDPGASETRYCKIYLNGDLVEELTSDTEMYIPAVVGDVFDVDLYYLVEGDSESYSYLMTFLLNITDEEGEIILPRSPDICGDGTAGPDGSVNLFDFNCLALEWLNSPCIAEEWCSNADIDRSGEVGLSDLVELANEWLFISVE